MPEANNNPGSPARMASMLAVAALLLMFPVVPVLALVFEDLFEHYHFKQHPTFYWSVTLALSASLLLGVMPLFLQLIGKLSRERHTVTTVLAGKRNMSKPELKWNVVRPKWSVFAIASLLATLFGLVAIVLYFCYEDKPPFLKTVCDYWFLHFPFASIGWGIVAIMQNFDPERCPWWLAFLIICPSMYFAVNVSGCLLFILLSWNYY